MLSIHNQMYVRKLDLLARRSINEKKEVANSLLLYQECLSIYVELRIRSSITDCLKKIQDVNEFINALASTGENRAALGA